jgi:hypothetical protein
MVGLVAQDQVICDVAFKVILSNLNTIVDRAWDVTKKFLAMELLTENMTEDEKSPHKEKYA